MSAVTIVFTILQVLSGLAVTAIVLMQSGKSAGLSGAISGGADTFLSKGKAKTLDAKLAKATKWFALAFVLLTLILNLVGESKTEKLPACRSRAGSFLFSGVFRPRRGPCSPAPRRRPSGSRNPRSR